MIGSKDECIQTAPDVRGWLLWCGVPCMEFYINTPLLKAQQENEVSYIVLVHIYISTCVTPVPHIDLQRFSQLRL